MNMEMGQIPDNLLSRVGDLWSLAFEYREPSFWDPWLRNCPSLQHYGVFDSNQVYACISIHDFEMRLFDRWLPCGGIAGVASSPGSRGEGLMPRLMAYCLQLLEKKKVPLACLGTGIPAFYERMGFASTDWHYEIEASTRALSAFKQHGSSRNYRMLALDDIAECRKVHELWVEKCPLSIRRSEERWRLMLSRPDFKMQVLIHEQGYMLVDLSASEAQKKFILKDWAAVTESAYYDGLALMARMQSQYETARWRDYDGERIFSKGTLDEPPRIELSSGMMSRVVHLETFAEYLHSYVQAPGDLLQLVDISDPLGVTAGAADSSSETLEGKVRLSPGQLLQLLTGFWRRLPAHWPEELNGLARSAGAIPFTCERF